MWVETAGAGKALRLSCCRAGSASTGLWSDSSLVSNHKESVGKKLREGVEIEAGN